LFEDDELTGAGEEEQHADRTIKRIFGSIGNLLREGMEAGMFRLASIPHSLQSIAGLTVYHFASGEFGEELIGQPLFTAAELRRRKQEVKALLHHGLTVGARKPTK
jgi:hypothetical protein